MQTHRAITAITTVTRVSSFTMLQIDKIRVIKGAKETAPSQVKHYRGSHPPRGDVYQKQGVDSSALQT